MGEALCSRRSPSAAAAFTSCSRYRRPIALHSMGKPGLVAGMVGRWFGGRLRVPWNDPEG